MSGSFEHSVLCEFGKHTFKERGVRLMIAEEAATRGRMHELIRVRELASSHKLEQMRRVRMLEK